MIQAGFLGTLLAVAVLLAVFALMLILAAPAVFRHFLNRFLVRVLTGKPGYNQMLQWVTVLRNTDFESMMSIMRRAETGRPFTRPFGSTRNWLHGFEELVFIPAQLGAFPRAEKDVDTRVILGPAARKPLELAVPIMITGMAHGLALTKEAKIALAKAASRVGTLTNSGESGYLDEERQAAKLYAVQYNRGGFNNRPEQLKQVDYVEIQFGQGADASAGESARWSTLSDWTRQSLRLKSGEDAVIHTRFPRVNSAGDLRRLVQELRDVTGGAPIGVKLCAGNVEADLAVAVEAGVDVISVDGAQGSTGSGYDFTINDFGIPTIYAIPRAHRFLEQAGVRDRVTLVASGGLRSSGDFLKALALGADAVYVGTAILLAMVQAQVARIVPYATPYELFSEKGRFTSRFDPEQAAEQAANFLSASAAEMVEGARALGKSSLGEVSLGDLYALSREAAEITGARLAYFSQDGTLSPNLRPAMATGRRGAATSAMGAKMGAGVGAQGNQSHARPGGSGERGRRERGNREEGRRGEDGRPIQPQH